MNTAERRQFIAKSPWFLDAPAKVLDGLAEASALKSYAAGQFLWCLGEVNTNVFGVVSGRVRLSVVGTMGQEFAIVDRTRGTWLGELCLMDDLGRANEARAMSPADILVMPRQALVRAARAWPLLYRNLFAGTVDNHRGLYEILASVLFLPLRARVIGRLIMLLGEHGREVDDGILIDLKLSQKDFALLTMGSRQRVNRVFRDLDKAGLVIACGDKLLVKDLTRLEKEILPYLKITGLGEVSGHHS